MSPVAKRFEPLGPVTHGERHRRRFIVCNRACIQPRRPALHPLPVLAFHCIFAPARIRHSLRRFVVCNCFAPAGRPMTLQTRKVSVD